MIEYFYNIALITVLMFSHSARAEKIDCVATPPSMFNSSEVWQAVEQYGNPFGFWKYEAEEGFVTYMHIFMDYRQDKLGLVRFGSLPLVGPQGTYNSVEICISDEKRIFLKIEEQLIRIKFASENLMQIATDSYDPNFADELIDATRVAFP